MLTFDEATHTYTLDGKILPSVTQILTAALGDRFPETARVAFAGDRGTEVHRTIALDLAGDLDEASVDPRVATYLAGARLFCREMGFKPTGTETRLADGLRKFAGTVDAWSEGGMLVDWKTSEAADESWKYQTAGYYLLLSWHTKRPPQKRMAVQLTKKGKYRIQLHKNMAEDCGQFLAYLSEYEGATK